MKKIENIRKNLPAPSISSWLFSTAVHTLNLSLPEKALSALLFLLTPLLIGQQHLNRRNRHCYPVKWHRIEELGNDLCSVHLAPGRTGDLENCCSTGVSQGFWLIEYHCCCLPWLRSDPKSSFASGGKLISLLCKWNLFSFISYFFSIK